MINVVKRYLTGSYVSQASQSLVVVGKSPMYCNLTMPSTMLNSWPARKTSLGTHNRSCVPGVSSGAKIAKGFEKSILRGVQKRLPVIMTLNIWMDEPENQVMMADMGSDFKGAMAISHAFFTCNISRSSVENVVVALAT